MRNLKLVLAGLVLSGAAFAADDPVNWKHTAEIRTRMQNDYNSNGLEAKAQQPQQDSTGWEQRNRMGILASKGEQFTGYLNVLHAATWGRDLGTATIGSASGDTTSTAGRNNPDNVVIMPEAWIAWRPSDMMTWKIGRGAHQMADGTVVGINDHEQVPVVFEGIMGTFDFGFLNLGVMGVKGAELGTGTAYELAYDQEANFYGLTFDLKNLPDFLKRAHLHVIREHVDVANPVTTHGKTTTRWGLNLNGDYMNIDYNLTYASVDGKKRHSSLSKDPDKDVKLATNMMDIKAGYTLPEFYNFRIGVVYHQDSGDKDGCREYAATDCDNTDNTYDGFYYDRFNNRSGIGKIGWGNSTYTGINLSAVPLENTKFGFNYWMFSRTSAKDEAYANDGVSWLQAASTKALNGTGHSTTYTGTGDAVNDRKALSTEWDLTAQHSYSENFVMEARYSQMMLGSFFKKSSTTEDLKRDSISQFWLSAKLKL